MEVKIYQIDMERDKQKVCFFGSDLLKKYNLDVDPAIYNLTYEGKLPCSALEDVFTLLNLGILYRRYHKPVEKPVDYTCRALSVSDVVQVISDREVKPGFYFVDDFGFRKIEFNPSLTGGQN